MTYRGYIKNGQVTLDEPTPLPEGGRVNIEIVQTGDSPSQEQLEAILRDRLHAGPSTPMTDADFDAIRRRLDTHAAQRRQP